MPPLLTASPGGTYDRVLFYSVNGGESGEGRAYVLVCPACGSRHHLGFFEQEGRRVPYARDCDDDPRWLQTSTETAFERDLMRLVSNQL